MGQSRMFGDDEPHDGQTPSPRTTIVGGRPPDDHAKLPDVPTGIQRLLRLASVDPQFRDELLERREELAQAAGVELTATERSVLRAISAKQLLGMCTRLPEPTPARRDFLRQSAATAVVLLGGAALGEALSGCNKPGADTPLSGGPPAESPPATGTGAVPQRDAGAFATPPTEPTPDRPEVNPTQLEGGISPDVPPVRPTQNPMAPGGMRPDLEPQPVPPQDTHPTRGIRPDVPPELDRSSGNGQR
jgi:hypothetical protein